MKRLVVLAALLAVAAWLARDAPFAPFQQFVDRLAPAASPRDSYRQALQRTGLAETPLAQQWLSAGESAVNGATAVSLPLQRTTRIVDDQPTAVAYRVTLNRGQRIDVIAELGGDVPAEAFIDIFGRDSAITHEKGGVRSAQFEATEEQDIIVRVQPELWRGGHLRVSLRAAPALRFPVADARPRDLQSGFGDPRDAGRRRHEGVDIFAKRGTDVLAAANGVVTRVNETAIGGKVVWIWDPQRSLMLYYAHLDSQQVGIGDRIAAGAVIGTVGNTGNARTTPPHLHFGIYGVSRGAIDPYWFIVSPAARTRAAHP